MLNCEHAHALALQDDVEWLLHCDSDELLHLNSVLNDAPRFFGRLSARGVNMYSFKNVEGVPVRF